MIVCEFAWIWVHICSSLCESAQICPSLQQICASLHESAQVCSNLRGFLRICESLCGSARVCAVLRESAHVYVNMREFMQICVKLSRRVPWLLHEVLWGNHEVLWGLPCPACSALMLLREWVSQWGADLCIELLSQLKTSYIIAKPLLINMKKSGW